MIIILSAVIAIVLRSNESWFRDMSMDAWLNILINRRYHIFKLYVLALFSYGCCVLEFIIISTVLVTCHKLLNLALKMATSSFFASTAIDTTLGWVFINVTVAVLLIRNRKVFFGSSSDSKIVFIENSGK